MKKNTTKKLNPISEPLEKQDSKSISFPVVGIGASAGGLEALKIFFNNVPENSGLAYIVIQHLDPNQEGILSEILQRETKMKVLQVTDFMKVKSNHVHVIPPNKSMSILNGHLRLFEAITLDGLHLPIDYFFYSLANDQNENGIGVVLSGMGLDGSSGLKAIKENGGFVLVQDPKDAKFDGMPKSAIKAVSVDVLATANELPKHLISFLKNLGIKLSENSIFRKNENNLSKIILLLRLRTEHDFSLYKKNTLYRRIERRMNVHQITEIENYVWFLQDNPIELDILFKEMLIGVTSFFRDASLWDKLKERVLPELFKALPNGYVLRAWISACSSGEEAYSLAVILMEAYEKVKNKKNITFQIFASDIDIEAIEKARKGFYTNGSMASVPSERINMFFDQVETGFRVKANIREMIVFAEQNVIKDPPFTKLDLVFCRNLLIYLQPELQKKLMNLFHYSLNGGGIMVLGTAENINSENNKFKELDRSLKIYKNSERDKHEILDFPDSFIQPTKRLVRTPKSQKMFENVHTVANQLLLEKYTPPSVLVNSDGDILYINGRTGKYLEPAAGKANMNIYAMAREGLRNMLPRAIQKVKEIKEPLELNHLAIGVNDSKRVVNVTLQLINKPEFIRETIIIVFNDVTHIQKENFQNLKTNVVDLAIEEEELMIELLKAKGEIQSLHEDMQAAQEELKSTNEEMQSTNEELQSTNEEHTTSKEEMLSLNEELQTINTELQTKVADYIVAKNDMKNLLDSIDVAALFLDKDLNIRRFTEQLSDIFKIRDLDIGRPFTDLVSSLKYPEMLRDANEVLKKLITIEKAINANDNKWFAVRIMPYRTFDDHIGGLVITFIDITKFKKMELKLSETIKILREHKIDKK